MITKATHVVRLLDLRCSTGEGVPHRRAFAGRPQGAGDQADFPPRAPHSLIVPLLALLSSS